MKKLLAIFGLWACVGQDALSAQDKGPVKLSLSANPPPIPALRFALLPELREQVPGNAAPLYRQAAELLKRTPADARERIGLQTVMATWETMPLAQLPRNELRSALALFKEPLQLLEKATRSEYCDWELAQRLREHGISTTLAEMQQLRTGSQLFYVKAKLELAEEHPEQALRTIRNLFVMGKHVGEAPPLICHLIGIALTARASNILEEAIAHPRTPNLYWSLTNLPRPFLDPRKAFEGERLMVYGTFPGVLELINNPEAGPLKPEQLEKLIRMVLNLENSPVPQEVRRFLIAAAILTKHETAKKALVAQGRSREKVDQWPHAQVAIMHALTEYDQLLDEAIKWHSFPFWQASAGLEKYEKRARSRIVRAADDPAIALSPPLAPAIHKITVARFRIERQLAALRCLEAIRLYAAEHQGHLPTSLVDIRDIPILICPITGKPFVYERMGDGAAMLSAPPIPKGTISVRPLSYELTLRR